MPLSDFMAIRTIHQASVTIGTPPIPRLKAFAHAIESNLSCVSIGKFMHAEIPSASHRSDSLESSNFLFILIHLC